MGEFVGKGGLEPANLGPTAWDRALPIELPTVMRRLTSVALGRLSALPPRFSKSLSAPLGPAERT